MALKEVAPLLAKDFVMLKIDNERMTGGGEMFTHYCPQSAGIPWFALLGVDGKAVATSDHPDTGNMGFPTEEAEYVYLRQIIGKVARRLTPADLDVLITTLRKEKPTT
ncbi:MAG: hypothetical protein ACM3NQ_03045 [Bacteroidales bacterium]